MTLQEYRIKGNPMLPTGIIGDDDKELTTVDAYQLLEELSAEVERLRKQKRQCQEFIAEVAAPALQLAVMDYPLSIGPKDNLRQLKELQTKLKS